MPAVSKRSSTKIPKEFNATQLEAIGMLGEGVATKSLICEKLKIDRKTLWNWMQKTEFQEAIKDVTDKLFREYRPKLYENLKSKCDDLDVHAMRIAFQLGGELSDVIKHTGDVTITLSKPKDMELDE